MKNQGYSGGDYSMRRCILVSLTILLIAGMILLIGCSGSSQPGTVNVSLSDPPTCMAPQGPYLHIYVTVSDVQIHQSANASNHDPGWIDLTPGLQNGPVQVDLLGTSNQCFLAMLGSAGIQPGSYQQLRIFLANSGTVNNNKCGVMTNCIILSADPANPQPLQLPSEAQTGIKIPSGQIAGGQFTIASGETKDLNIDFNACASIVIQGNSQYRLKPVLHAGEVALQSSSTAISGTIIDNATQQTIVGGNTVVALEQNVGGIDRVIMETVPNSAGGFSFCPVPAGTYDIVATAINGAGVAYAATVITGVQPGNSLGTIPLTPVGLPASITGQITSSTGSAGIAIDVTASALESIGNNIQVTVPLAQQSASSATLSTVSGSCPATTDCISYTFSLPASNPSIGTVNTAGNQSPAAPSAGPVSYTIDGMAYVSGSNQADCTTPDLQTTVNNVTAGSPFTATTLAFSGCQ
jgi:uncharacterized protein DUF4382